MAVRVFDLTGKRKALVRVVERVALHTLKEIRKKNADIEIYIIGEARMKALNSKFRKKNESTNVLSFPYTGFLDPEKGKNYHGEVYIAPAYSERKGEDLSQIIIHGILHLFGYDHMKDSDAVRMESMEEQICRTFKKKGRGI